MQVQQRKRQRGFRDVTHMPARWLGLLGALLLAGGTAEAAEPTTAPGETTVEVIGAYKAGQQLLLTRVMDMEVSRANADDDAGSVLHKSTITLEIPLRVSKSDTPGEVAVQLSVRRMAMKSESGGRVQEIDSDKPETLTDGGARGLTLAGARFHAVLDQAGKVKSITPDDEFLNGPHLAERPPDAQAREIEGLGAMLTFYLENPWAYVPNRSVAVGDSWSVLRPTYMVPFLGIRAGDDGPTEMPKEDMECTLDRVETLTPRGSAAVIQVAGKIKFPKGFDMDQDVTVTGTVRLDMVTRQLREHQMTVTTAKGNTTVRVTATTTLLPLPTRQPASAPAAAPAKQ